MNLNRISHRNFTSDVLNLDREMCSFSSWLQENSGTVEGSACEEASMSVLLLEGEKRINDLMVQLQKCHDTHSVALKDATTNQKEWSLLKLCFNRFMEAHDILSRMRIVSQTFFENDDLLQSPRHACVNIEMWHKMLTYLGYDAQTAPPLALCAFENMVEALSGKKQMIIDGQKITFDAEVMTFLPMFMVKCYCEAVYKHSTDETEIEKALMLQLDLLDEFSMNYVNQLKHSPEISLESEMRCYLKLLIKRGHLQLEGLKAKCSNQADDPLEKAQWKEKSLEENPSQADIFSSLCETHPLIEACNHEALLEVYHALFMHIAPKTSSQNSYDIFTLWHHACVLMLPSSAGKYDLEAAFDLLTTVRKHPACSSDFLARITLRLADILHVIIKYGIERTVDANYDIYATQIADSASTKPSSEEGTAFKAINQKRDYEHARFVNCRYVKQLNALLLSVANSHDVIDVRIKTKAYFALAMSYMNFSFVTSYDSNELTESVRFKLAQKFLKLIIDNPCPATPQITSLAEYHQGLLLIMGQNKLTVHPSQGFAYLEKAVNSRILSKELMDKVEKLKQCPVEACNFSHDIDIEEYSANHRKVLVKALDVFLGHNEYDLDEFILFCESFLRTQVELRVRVSFIEKGHGKEKTIAVFGCDKQSRKRFVVKNKSELACFRVSIAAFTIKKEAFDEDRIFNAFTSIIYRSENRIPSFEETIVLYKEKLHGIVAYLQKTKAEAKEHRKKIFEEKFFSNESENFVPAGSEKEFISYLTQEHANHQTCNATQNFIEFMHEKCNAMSHKYKGLKMVSHRASLIQKGLNALDLIKEAQGLIFKNHAERSFKIDGLYSDFYDKWINLLGKELEGVDMESRENQAKLFLALTLRNMKAKEAKLSKSQEGCLFLDNQDSQFAKEQDSFFVYEKLALILPRDQKATLLLHVARYALEKHLFLIKMSPGAISPFLIYALDKYIGAMTLEENLEDKIAMMKEMTEVVGPWREFFENTIAHVQRYEGDFDESKATFCTLFILRSMVQYQRFIGNETTANELIKQSEEAFKIKATHKGRNIDIDFFSCFFNDNTQHGYELLGSELQALLKDSKFHLFDLFKKSIRFNKEFIASLFPNASVNTSTCLDPLISLYAAEFKRNRTQEIRGNFEDSCIRGKDHIGELPTAMEGYSERLSMTAEAKQRAKEILDRQTIKSNRKQEKKISSKEVVSFSANPHLAPSEKTLPQAHVFLTPAAMDVFVKLFKPQNWVYESNVDCEVCNFRNDVKITRDEVRVLIQSLGGQYIKSQGRGSHQKGVLPSIWKNDQIILKEESMTFAQFDSFEDLQATSLQNNMTKSPSSQTVVLTKDNMLKSYQIQQLRLKLIHLGYTPATVQRKSFV